LVPACWGIGPLPTMAGVLPGGPPLPTAFRPSSRSGSLPPRPASGGALLAEALASGAKVDPSGCLRGHDRLWLPQSARPAADMPGGPSARPPHAAAPKIAPVRAERPAVLASPGDTLRPEDLASPPRMPAPHMLPASPTAPSAPSAPAAPAVGSRAAPRLHAATAPMAQPDGVPQDNANGRGAPDADAAGRRRRPASAGGRLAWRPAGVSDIAAVPPAGMRLDEQVKDIRQNSPSGKSRAGQEGLGWKPRTMEPQEQYRHDPILHRVDVFVRGPRGEVEPSHTAKGEYFQAMRQAALPARRCAGRRKGVGEFAEASALNAPKWDPTHAAALKADHHIFHRQQGEFSEMYNNAKRYPCTPRPFEPKGIHPTSCAPGFPARPCGPQFRARPSSARMRRPDTAGRSSVQPAQPVTKLTAPPSAQPVTA